MFNDEEHWEDYVTDKPSPGDEYLKKEIEAVLDSVRKLKESDTDTIPKVGGDNEVGDDNVKP